MKYRAALFYKRHVKLMSPETEDYEEAFTKAMVGKRIVQVECPSHGWAETNERTHECIFCEASRPKFRVRTPPAFFYERSEEPSSDVRFETGGRTTIEIKDLGRARILKQMLIPEIQIQCPVHGWSDLWEDDCVECYSESFDQQRD